MKHPLLLLLIITSLNTFSQAPTSSGLHTLTIHPGRNGDYDTLSFDIRMRPKYDTVRAELLVTFTSRRWGVAHARPGYVVKRGGEVVWYLNDHKKRFPPQVAFWGWRIKGGGR